MKYPFLVILTPFILGILTTDYVKINICIIFIISLLLYLYYIIIDKKLNQILFLFLLLILFFWGMERKNIAENSTLENYIDKNCLYKASVKAIDSSKKDKTTYLLSVSEVNLKPIEKEYSLVNIWDENLEVDLGIGDELIYKAKNVIPSENTNPKLFNYRKYLKANKIFTTSNIKVKDIIQISKNKSKNFMMKKSFIKYIDKKLSLFLKGKNYKLIKSIIFGDSTYLDKDIRNIYNDLGLAHILAVSGLHIGIMTFFLSFIFNHIYLNKNISRIITIFFIWIYAYIINFPPSILRGSLVCTLIYLSKLIKRPYSTINLLSFSMFILLVINPLYIYSLGFQLSYLASFSISVLGPYIYRQLKRSNKNLAKILSSILAVDIGSMPINCYYFNSIKVLSIISNIIIVPLISLALYISFILLIMPSQGIIFDILGKLANFILDIQFILIDYFNLIPLSNIDIFSPSWIFILLYYIFLLILFNIKSIKKLDLKFSKILFFYLAFISLINFKNIFFNEKLEIYFIDVGQGDSAILSYKNKNYMIDTGGTIFGDFKVGKNITLPFLQKHGIRKVDGLFISHFDYDHYEAIFDLLPNIDIGKIFIPYPAEDEEFIELINSNQIPVEILQAYKRVYLADKLSMDIVWPCKEKISDRDSDNNKSMVILLKYLDKRILFTGDIEREVEDNLNYKTIQNIDILKLAHHGSKTSSGEKFLRETSPKTGIISVGRKNKFNHPGEEVLERCNNQDISIWRTDEDGLIKIEINRYNYKINSYLNYKNRYPIDVEVFLKENFEVSILYFLYFVIMSIWIRSLRIKEEDIFCIIVNL